MARTTFVTVVFEEEWALLELQARSIARFVPEDLPERILVIDNGTRPLKGTTWARVREAYGPHASRVDLVPSRALSRVPLTSGWRSQQVLKLTVAERVSTPLYVTLDAKNHFVAPLEASFFVAPDGRPRAGAHSYEQHPLREDLERVLRYLDLDPGPWTAGFPRTVTPFVLVTEVARELVRTIEARSGKPFAAEFVANRLTEFFLYSGFLVASGRGIDTVYALDLPSCPIVFPRRATAEGVREAVRDAEERDVPVFAVHRRALAVVDGAARAELAAFWTRAGLFPSDAAARAWLGSVQRSAARRALLGRARKAPGKLAEALRRKRRPAPASAR